MDWTLRHGRGIALGIALKEGPEKVWTDQYQSAVKNTVTSLVESDRVSCGIAYVQVNYKNIN